MIKKNYKDKCDECNEFGYLKGYENKCLCEKCIKELKRKTISKNTNINFMQFTIYDILRKENESEKQFK